MAKRKPNKVAVLGGGLSGLAAALELAEQGVEVTVFEASHKVGGHIDTRKIDGEYSWDAGAELIDSNQIEIRNLAAKLGVKITESGPSGVSDAAGDKFHIGGRTYAEEDMLKAYKPLAAELKKYQAKLRNEDGSYTRYARNLDNTSMEEFLNRVSRKVRSRDFDKAVVTAIKQAYTGEFGRDPNELSALAFLDMIGTDVQEGFKIFGKSDEAFCIEGGSSRLVEALHARLEEMGVKIETNTPVAALKNTRKGIDLSVIRDGERHTEHFDYAISTLQLQTLQKMDGLDQLGLPKDHLGAVRNAVYATLTKIGFRPKVKPWEDPERNWSGCLYTDGGTQTFWADQHGNIVAYTGGASGREEVADRIKKAKADYARAVGLPESEIFQEKGGVAVMKWQQGKGCFVTPSKGNYMGLISLREQKHPHLGLAGEYVPSVSSGGRDSTGYSSVGYMGNAVESAQREAHRAIEILRGRHQGNVLGAFNDMNLSLKAERGAGLSPAA